MGTHFYKVSSGKFPQLLRVGRQNFSKQVLGSSQMQTAAVHATAAASGAEDAGRCGTCAQHE